MPVKLDIAACLRPGSNAAGLLARAGGAGPQVKEERLSPPFRWGDNLRLPLDCVFVITRTVSGIVRGFNFREPLHACRVDLGDDVLERNAIGLFRDLAILNFSLKGDELPLLKRLGEVLEIAPGIDAMPLGAVFVITPFVLPALAGRQTENDVFLVVLCGFDFCILSETTDEDDFVEHCLWLRYLGLSAGCGTCLPGGCADATHSQGD
jgi:hypothetical protein